MVAIQLKSGAYSAQGYLANSQRCINLFPEMNPEDTEPEAPFTHYPRPGNRLLAQPPAPAMGRCLYCATNGDLYAVIGQNIYYIDPNWVFTFVGTMVTVASTPVSMADNGQAGGNAIIVVDNSTFGYNITMTTRAFAQIGDPNFLGSTRADFLDTFLLLNNPNTNQWYSTLAGQLAFNGLYIGVKTAWPDNILCVIAIEREALLLGPKKGEVWYNAGGVPFPFNILPGVIIEQGCAARYSPAKMDTNVYWLSQSPEGDRMVMRMNNQNVAQRISTHAIESELRNYARVDDAIGSTYQVQGHSFYKLHFPAADKTWGYDEATKQWHEDNYVDQNGILHRARNTFMAFAYGKNVGLDFSNGNLYQVDPNYRFDDMTLGPSTVPVGQPIAWIRSFPHVIKEMKRISHSRFIADVQTGNSVGTGETGQFLSPWSSGFSSGFGPRSQVAAPSVSLRYSRDGGARFSNNRLKYGISSGRYRSLLRWPSLGIARDMVFEISSTADMCDALNGAFIDPMMGTS